MSHPTATASHTKPIIGTMDTAQLAAAQANTARALAAPRVRCRTPHGSGHRLSAYCGCCGCITRYCICSCCCQK